MSAAHTATPEVTVSISITRKEQGALYMKSLRQADCIKELKATNDDLVKALQAAHALITELRPHHPVLLETGDALDKAGAA